jgi:YHS domain-containing protein
MSEYKWCHGQYCHQSRTQDRVRGSKGSKVLRTRKVKQTAWNRKTFYKYFCSNSCYNDFANANIERIVAIAPRHTPLETPIEDPKKVEHQSDYNPSYSWTETEIKEKGVDTAE